jgi:hypothetical protein
LIACNKIKGAILRTLAHAGKHHARNIGARNIKNKGISEQLSVLKRVLPLHKSFLHHGRYSTALYVRPRIFQL